MGTDQPQSGDGLEGARQLGRERRPRMKDSLLAENPPWMLGGGVGKLNATL
jgi:hypothetical protein